MATSSSLPLPVAVNKRRAYGAVLLTGIAAVLAGWFLKAYAGEPLHYEEWAYPLLLGSLSELLVGLWRNVVSVTVVERLCFTTLSFYTILRYFGLITLSHEVEGMTADLVGFSYWFFAVYAAAFLMFGAKHGLRIAATYYLALAAVGSLHLMLAGYDRAHFDEVYVLLHLYLTGGLVIFLLHNFARLTEGHARSVQSLERLAATDALTQVSNRRFLEWRLDEEVARAERYGSKLSVVLIDLDDFKGVNDTFGHDVGDEVLKRVARLLDSKTRSPDHVGRWGGEEFLLVLPEVGEPEAKQSALRLQESIAAQAWKETPGVTASIGVVEFQRGDSMEALVKRADKAMYQAKASGKNQVVVASDTLVVDKVVDASPPMGPAAVEPG